LVVKRVEAPLGVGRGKLARYKGRAESVVAEALQVCVEHGSIQMEMGREDLSST
jgi:hypothetical protein